MKVRNTHIVVTLAFGLIALLGLAHAPSASAGTFTAEEDNYPLILEGGQRPGGGSILMLHHYPQPCAVPTFATTLSEETLEMTTEEAQGASCFGTMNLNGCQLTFELEPEDEFTEEQELLEFDELIFEGAVSLGPPGCGPVEAGHVGIPMCGVRIWPGTLDGDVDFQKLDGNYYSFHTVASLQWQLTGGGSCAYHENEWYKGTWEMKGVIAGTNEEVKIRVGGLEGWGPSTRITNSSPPITKSPAWFSFSSFTSGATFECSLNESTFSACTSPHSPAGLEGGANEFQVRAVHGELHDESPAKVEFSVTPTAPSAVTASASGVKPPQATMNATVNPMAAGTTYQFEVGTSSSYGTAVPSSPESIGGRAEDIEVSETIEGLEPNTTYHYRIRATNSVGTTYGKDKTFTTDKWATITVEDPQGSTSNFNDVWCIAKANCFGVGAWDSSGLNHVHVAHWDGSAWGIQDAPAPPGAWTSELEGVTCISSSYCLAVGRATETHADETTATKTLALLWDGESWSQAPTEDPQGAIDSRLSEVSCVSKTECVAVGRYTDAEEEQKTLTMLWDGEEWSLLSSPNASGASKNELVGLSCPGSSECVAVGSFVNGSDVTKTLAMAWDGSSWAIESTPEPAGATLSRLADVKCTSSTACVAVGNHFDAGGVQKTLVLGRDATSWSLVASPNPDGALASELSGLSCTGPSACTAVGGYRNGTGLVPLALRWNGTSWSEQALEVENHGAVSVQLSSASCASATACHAVGSISYGHGGERRALGYRWSDSEWSPSTAGALQRSWEREAVANVEGGLRDVQCFESTQDCRIAGVFTDGSGAVRARVGEKADLAAPEPEGATSSTVEAISCPSSTQCAAVGSFEDDEGKEWALALDHTESGWSDIEAPVPSGAGSSRLEGLSCPGATECVAVGQFRSGAGEDTLLALHWDGSEWSLMALDPPAGATSSELLDVDCAAASNCAAVGRYRDSEGKPQALALHWDGTEWQPVTPTSQLEELSSRLSAVDCPSASVCVAVGNYVSQEGEVRSLSMRSSEADPLLEWEYVQTPQAPEGTTVTTSDVSCASASACVAVGTLFGEEGPAPLTLRLSEGTWSDLELGPPDGLEADGYELSAVSCPLAGECEAVGRIKALGGQHEDLTYTIAHQEGEWEVSGEAGGPSTGGLGAVSCVRTLDPGAASCVAIGAHSDPTGSGGVSWTHSRDDGWRMVPFGEETGSLSDVDCSSSDACTAVGEGSGSWAVRRFDGDSWSAQASASIPGASSVYARGVSCPAAQSCAVAGSSVKEGQSSPLLAIWDGSEWSPQTVPLQMDDSPVLLHDVSCATAQSCIAVGRTVDGTKAAIVTPAGGSDWSLEAAPVPIGTATAELDGVSCTAPNVCTAVGTYRTSAAPNLDRALIVRWDGSDWSLQSAPPLPGSESSALTDVSCFSPSGCVAVAEGEIDSMIAWDGTSWSVESTAFGAGGGFEEPGAVSCSSALDCLAVGEVHGDGEPAPLALRPRQDALGSSGETAGGGDPALTLSALQREQAEALIAEDPVLMAKIGSGEYTIRLIPFTETNGVGEQVMIGVAGVLMMNEPLAWAEYEAWPSITWNSPIEPDPYVEGLTELAGEDVVELQFNLAATFDEGGNLVSGEVVQLEPLETGGAEVTQEGEEEPETGHDSAWGGY